MFWNYKFFNNFKKKLIKITFSLLPRKLCFKKLNEILPKVYLLEII